MGQEKIEELVIVFKQASPRTMSLDRDVVREGLTAVLAIVERESRPGRIAQAAYEAGQRDLLALQKLGF